VATKEDILEQLVEEFLTHRGYFVRHNLKFLPSKEHPDWVRNQDSNHSDIDVIGYNPLLKGADRVWVVSCKSWQIGFNPKTKITEIEHGKVSSGRQAWKSFRVLASPKWSEGFISAVQRATGQKTFTYVTAVTKLTGDATIWETHQPFVDAMGGNPIKVITLQQMLEEVYGQLSHTLAGTEIGRMLQLVRAAGIRIDS
jgi:hypothetical protein